MTEILSRVLVVEGAHNVRDLGGYAARDGKITQWRRIIRADSLHKLTQEAQQQLLEAGVRTVIDLRSREETAQAPNPLAHREQVTYLHLPIFEDTLTDNPQIFQSPEPFVIAYSRMLDERQPQIRAIMRAVASADEAGVLFHCMMGKDRTGVTAALLLALAGVDNETIATDYALTAECIREVAAVYRAAAIAQGIDGDVFDRLMASNADDMLGTLAHLERMYGGADAYLERIGLERSMIDQLRHRLIER